MHGSGKPPEYTALWAQLQFQGFDPEILKTRLGEWMWYAEECLLKLNVGNTVLEADTSAGKTIIALMTSMALQVQQGWRTLFLVPQVGLAYQHQRLLQKLHPTFALQSCIITGQDTPTKRNWSQPHMLWTFATPAALHNDLRQGKCDLQQFQFIVFDEMHLGMGAYAYVPIAQAAAIHGIRTLGLSATLGRKVEQLRKNFSIVAEVKAKITTASKTESLIQVPISETLQLIEQHFKILFTRLSEALVGYGYKVDPQRVMSIREADVLRKEIQALPEVANFAEATVAFRSYFKLLYGYITIFAEGYETFLDYVDRKVIQLEGHSHAADWLMDQPEFIRILTLTEQERERHPKVLAFLELCASLARAGQSGFVFFSQKATARYLTERLRELGYKVDTVFGGSSKNLTHERSVLARLQAGELQFVLTTSTLELGRDLPAVGVAVHYSMPLTATSRKQRTGRAGRIRTGTVVFVCIDHPLDMVFYYTTRESPRRILTKIPANILSLPLRRPTPTRRRRHKDTATLDLFQ